MPRQGIPYATARSTRSRTRTLSLTNTKSPFMNSYFSLSRLSLTQETQIPPFGNLSISRHKASMYVRLVVHGPPRLHPYLLAEVEEGVRDDGCNGCKGQAVGHSKRRRQEEWSVRLVLLYVKRCVRVRYGCDVVTVPIAVERRSRRYTGCVIPVVP